MLFMPQLFFNGKNLQVNGKVYQPREDSFLLANAIRDEDAKGKSCLDLCSGSGIQAINLMIKGARNVVAADVSAEALKNVEENSKIYGFVGKIFPLKSNLFEDVKGLFDLIVCNPPYVQSERIVDKAVDAGPKGRAVIDKFLIEFRQFLDNGGVCYFLQNNINGIDETEKFLQNHGLKFEIVARQKLFFEELLVYRAERI